MKINKGIKLEMEHIDKPCFNCKSHETYYMGFIDHEDTCTKLCLACGSVYIKEDGLDCSALRIIGLMLQNIGVDLRWRKKE